MNVFSEHSVVVGEAVFSIFLGQFYNLQLMS